MLLKNFYIGRAIKMSGEVTTGVATIKNLAGSTPVNVLGASNWDMFGSTSESSSYPSMNFMRSTTSGYGGVIIGTGTTAPTLDDYCLSGDMIKTFTYSAAITATHDSDGLTLTGVYTITNTGSDAFTIGEIGILASSHKNTSTETYKCLVERTVLDSPVTIAAGGVGQVAYTIRMNYPT